MILQNQSCTEKQFKCKNGQCIDLQKVCDLKVDCNDSSDERDEICKVRVYRLHNTIEYYFEKIFISQEKEL